MADFVAVLTKTIDGLGERNSPDVRQRVYERARKAIADKLAAVTPPPSAAQCERQYKLLDEAIATVEAGYAPPPVAVKPDAKPVSKPVSKPSYTGDPLADFLASADDSLKATTDNVASPVVKAADAFRQPLPAFPGIAEKEVGAQKASTSPDPVLGLDGHEPLSIPPAEAIRTSAKNKGSGKGLIYGLLGLLVIGGAGYAGYTYKDQILGTVTLEPTEPSAAATPAGEAEKESAKPADTPAATPADTPAAIPAVPQEAPKMTQRLTPEGQEIDTGASTTPPDVGEGSTVASATTPSSATPPAAGTASAQPAQPQAIAVGQKAIFYEEKTGTQAGTADQGAVVWTVVQDSPGLEQPPEPAIRGEINIPDKGIVVKLTIKRNVDKSLPASHIIEMLFSTPVDFAGGAIDVVSRFAMKDTEQSPGNPLVGVPANFGDGFFLIALTDEKSAIDTNISLLDRQNWIDVPVAYKTGRRALLSFEKGLAGDKVFKEVLKAWEAKALAPATPAASGG